MWTETTQPQYRREGLRYASDIAEWVQIEALLPLPKKLGRPRRTALREVVNAMLYLLTTGCQWRLLPKEFPPFSTVQRFFYRWRDAGLWPTINRAPNASLSYRGAGWSSALLPGSTAIAGWPKILKLDRKRPCLTDDRQRQAAYQENSHGYLPLPSIELQPIRV